MEDIIVISDDDAPSCSKKDCKTNPNCLNYLGQESWEDEGTFHGREQLDPYNSLLYISLTFILKDAPEEKLVKFTKLGRDPSQYTREADLPVGLKVRSDC